jgi:hypothetical protein
MLKRRIWILLQWNVERYLRSLDSQINKSDLKEDSADRTGCGGAVISEWDSWRAVQCGKRKWASKWVSAGTTASHINRARQKHIANGLFGCSHYSAPLLKSENVWISFLTSINSNYCGIGSLLIFQWRIYECLRTSHKFEIKAHRIFFFGNLINQKLTVASI